MYFTISRIKKDQVKAMLITYYMYVMFLAQLALFFHYITSHVANIRASC